MMWMGCRVPVLRSECTSTWTPGKNESLVINDT